MGRESLDGLEEFKESKGQRDDGSGKDQAVAAIEHATVAGQRVGEVLEMKVAFDGGKDEVADSSADVEGFVSFDFSALRSMGVLCAQAS